MNNITINVRRAPNTPKEHIVTITLSIRATNTNAFTSTQTILNWLHKIMDQILSSVVIKEDTGDVYNFKGDK
jgi:hypothetical protein